MGRLLWVGDAARQNQQPTMLRPRSESAHMAANDGARDLMTRAHDDDDDNDDDDLGGSDRTGP